jgi:glycosyltransferase involved in cell wall biosynthesis
MSRAKICILLPALNEEATIGRVIDALPVMELARAGYEVRVLVADGNSTDGTRQIAAQKGADVVVEPRPGKGIAVITALGKVEADFIFMLDADATYPPDRIPDMLNLLETHDAVTGSRLRGRREPRAMSGLNLVGNRLLSLLATVLYGRRVSDVCTGLWGFRAGVVKSLRLTATAFELEVDLFSQLVRRGYSIAEIPIDYRRRADRPKLRSLRDGTRIGWALIARRFRRLDD